MLAETLGPSQVVVPESQTVSPSSQTVPPRMTGGETTVTVAVLVVAAARSAVSLSSRWIARSAKTSQAYSSLGPVTVVASTAPAVALSPEASAKPPPWPAVTF